MNRFHDWFCSSEHWRETVRQRVPWVVSGAELGQDVLELGPGPGLTTDLVRLLARRVTALEEDRMLADGLRIRLNGSNVEVVIGDATAMPFAGEQFSGGVSFTMLHHVPSVELQDKLLREVWRVLRPGGVFVGSDSLQSWFMRLIHIGDTLVPVDPDQFGARLENAGFEVVEIEKKAEAFRFHARKPSQSDRAIRGTRCSISGEDTVMKQDIGVRNSKPFRLTLLAALLCLTLPGLIWAADTEESTIIGTRTVEGLVRDIACPLQNKKSTATSYNKDCITMCLKSGSPLGILTNDGTLYVPVTASMPDTGQDALKPFVGQHVKATGKVYVRNGARAIEITEIHELPNGSTGK